MSLYNTDIITVDLTSAVTNFPVEIEGSSITHLTGSADVTVRLEERTANPIPLSPGDTIRLPHPLSFKKAFISGDGGGGTVTLLVCRPNIIVDKGQVFIAGQVDTKPNYTFVEDANYYSIGLFQVATASEFSTCVLWNPSGSGVDLYLARIQCGDETGVMTMKLHQFDAITALTELPGTTFDWTNFNVDTQGGSKASFCRGTLTSPEVAANRVDDYGPWLVGLQNVPYEWPLHAPMHIPEGYGVAVVSETANHRIWATFYWQEV